MVKKTFLTLTTAALCVAGYAQSRDVQRLPVPERSIAASVGDAQTGGSPQGSRRAAFATDMSRTESDTRVRANAPAIGMPQIYGAVISSSALSKGVYEIPSNAQSEFVKQPMERNTEVVDGSVCAVRQGDYYYSMTKEEFEFLPGFVIYNLDAWNVSDDGWSKRYSTEISASETATAMTVDPSTNVIYGSLVNENEDGYELCTIEFPKYKTGSVTRTAKGTLSQPLYAMAIAGDGVLYALQDDGQFVSVSRDNAQVTVIGSSTLTPEGKGSAVIDPTTGRFFCTVAPRGGTAGLYEIDKSTGVATLVYAFPGAEQVTGLYCTPSEAAPAAPGKATSLSADFPAGGLDGTVSFTAPITDADGNPAQGELTYTISLSGTVLATGLTEYGAAVSVPVTLPAEGEHEIVVVMSCEAGASEAATLKVRAGKGLPVTPTISASWDGTKMLVSWTPVTESADGLYLDPAQVTYRVTRYPGQVTVADAISATSLEDSFTAPDKFTIYYYEIEAIHAGKTSAPGRSEGVGVGAYSVPYSQDFGTEFYRDDLLDTFTIVDANGDGEGWAYNSYTEVMRCRTMAAENGADDWLILPAITLEKGMVYELSAKMHDGGETLKERVEIKMGLRNTPEAMTLSIMPECLVESADFKEFKSYVVPTEDGDWYIGYHCTTPGSEYYLYLDDILLTAKADAGLAQAPAEFTVTPGADGAHKATVSLKAPLLDVSGNHLASINKIVVSRDGTEIHTIADPIPGNTYTIEDNTVGAGNHDYKAVAWNRCGEGDPALTTAFVGFHKPMHPEWASAVETSNIGEVKMTWSAVTLDENGDPLPADQITYSVVHLAQDGSISRIIAEGLTITEHTFTAVGPGEQQFINFAVFAESEGGHSKGVIAPQIIVGTPYALPYRESFEDNGYPATLFTMATLQGGATWISMNDDSFADMKSHDLDSGYVAMGATGEGDRASLTTAKISLADAVNPVLSFYVFNMAGDWGRDDNEVEVQIGVGGDFTTVYSKPNYETGDADCWNLVAVPLGEFVGKDIQVRLIGTCRHASYTVIDEIEIKPWALYDLRSVGFTSPERMVANKPVTIIAEVENIGLNTAEGGAVVLYANDNAYMRQELPALASGKSARVAFNTKINPSFGKNVKLHVKVDLYEDVNRANDRCPARTFDLEQTLLPSPTSLTAVKAEGGNLTMSWTEPDMSSAVAARVTEDFESSTAWKSEVDGWTFYDLDKGGINGFEGVSFPGIPDGSMQSFWVMDDRLEDLNNTFAASSGHKYLANMNVIEGTTDDWAVSPRLCGKEHTLSFMAKSYNWMYPETFYVKYSTDGTNPKDFVDLKEFYEIPWDWTEYTVTLPEGTTHFAFHSNTDAGVMLFIDDVSFVPDGEAEALQLLGYNFYCDGIAVNSTPVKETSYIADGYNPEGHTYAVTALYDKGESAPSNILQPVAVDAAEADGVSIMAVGPRILVRGAEGRHVLISRVDGLTIYNDTPEADLSVDAEPGVYVVQAGDKVRKLIVR